MTCIFFKDIVFVNCETDRSKLFYYTQKLKFNYKCAAQFRERKRFLLGAWTGIFQFNSKFEKFGAANTLIWKIISTLSLNRLTICIKLLQNLSEGDGTFPAPVSSPSLWILTDLHHNSSPFFFLFLWLVHLTLISNLIFIFEVFNDGFRTSSNEVLLNHVYFQAWFLFRIFMGTFSCRFYDKFLVLVYL